MSPEQKLAHGQRLIDRGQQLITEAHEEQMRAVRRQYMIRQATSGDTLMSAAQVATMLRVSDSYVYRLRREGDMPFENGKIWRSQVIHWLCDNRPKRAAKLGFNLKTAI